MAFGPRGLPHGRVFPHVRGWRIGRISLRLFASAIRAVITTVLGGHHQDVDETESGSIFHMLKDICKAMQFSVPPPESLGEAELSVWLKLTFPRNRSDKATDYARRIIMRLARAHVALTTDLQPRSLLDRGGDFGLVKNRRVRLQLILGGTS